MVLISGISLLILLTLLHDRRRALAARIEVDDVRIVLFDGKKERWSIPWADVTEAYVGSLAPGTNAYGGALWLIFGKQSQCISRTSSLYGPMPGFDGLVAEVEKHLGPVSRLAPRKRKPKKSYH